MTKLEQYYRENFDTLVKRLGRIQGGVMAAEDVVHNAFERAIKYYESFNEESDFERWFSIILSNALKRHQNDVRNQGVTKSIEESEDEIEPIIPDDIRPILKDEVKRLAQDKTGTRKEVLRLTFEFGYKPSEIVTIVEDVTYRQVTRYLADFRQEVMEIYK